MSRFIDRLWAAVFTLSTLLFSGVASAGTVELFYNVPVIGISLDYRGMGYTDADGSFVDLAGSDIVSSRVVVGFRPQAGVDISTFHMAMVVPVSGATSQFFEVNRADLTETRPGWFTLDIRSDAFNGEIYSGRFSIESYGLDAFGNPIALPGFVTASTGFYYSVETSAVPEPSSAWLLVSGLMLVPLAVRRARP